MRFGLISEGPTDQATIENMLCGIFNDEELYELITPLQPGGSSDTNQEGGWERVLNYISNHKFRQSFSTVENVVIQIDTDVATLKGFDVDLRDDDGKTLKEVVSIFEKVKTRLVEQIESGEVGFYEKVKDRIIFAITVHSLEIWLFKHHSKNKSSQKIINSGENKLANELIKDRKLAEFTTTGKNKQILMIKTYDNYDQLSRKFYDSKTCIQSVNELCKVDESFQLFKSQLV
ncbi:DUF4276 family protein [Vibrio parahaemolyticus]|uniref:Uncharacterized protein n=1 Tax=Vibrio parahaemolyticus TaxID=670 RepID=A0AA47JDZ7_VIBPH|nr:hypothetical protein [Vibrio parahaemolyticus]MCQ9048813.1 hypothetical protein [Vibrio parahaemolyticus]MCX8778430.1 hypothetical protein [Vibrio parahaemolyticus]MEA5349439.1 hypothetical protein [Vibrio parahaemolyticus]WAT89045.1 hypothetical protein O1Q84_10305 [Vibrio parahaemolyticus]HCE2185753.1 hypothetical protein [Vibrio parahaemolyticus]